MTETIKRGYKRVWDNYPYNGNLGCVAAAITMFFILGIIAIVTIFVVWELDLTLIRIVLVTLPSLPIFYYFVGKGVHNVK